MTRDADGTVHWDEPEHWYLAHLWPGVDVDGDSFPSPLICPICSALISTGRRLNRMGNERIDYANADRHVAWHKRNDSAADVRKKRAKR